MRSTHVARQALARVFGLWSRADLGTVPGRLWQRLKAWACAALCGLAVSAQAADPFFDKLLLMGTGAPGGAFLPIGEALCQAVNAQRQGQDIRCVAPTTAGSIYNINAVNNGRLQLGLAQEDLVLEHAAGRRGPGYDGLRVVAVLHDSPISIVVRGDAKAQSLDQIKGLRINMGNRGSGQFTVSTALVKALGLAEKDFSRVMNEPTSAFERIFCGGAVDLVLEVVPHPSAVVEKLLACGGRLLPIPPAVARQLRAANPALVPMDIQPGSYPGVAAPVPSLGVRNLLISHERVSAESIARFIRRLGGQEAALKEAQPMLATMPPIAGRAAPAGPAPVPLHDGVSQALSR